MGGSTLCSHKKKVAPLLIFFICLFLSFHLLVFFLGFLVQPLIFFFPLSFLSSFYYDNNVIICRVGIPSSFLATFYTCHHNKELGVVAGSRGGESSLIVAIIFVVVEESWLGFVKGFFLIINLHNLKPNQ
jgi:hypothetical protein